MSRICQEAHVGGFATRLPLGCRRLRPIGPGNENAVDGRFLGRDVAQSKDREQGHAAEQQQGLSTIEPLQQTAANG